MIISEPLVTIYIPTYNRIDLLKRAVESVRSQSYQNLEIIIVDDCSTDGTVHYLEKLVIEDSRIRYFLKEKNSGACASRNIAIKYANGEYITGLDDDDIFLPQRIANFIYASKRYDMDNICLFSCYKFGTSNVDITVADRIKSFFIKQRVKQVDLLLSNYLGNQIFIKTKVLKKIKFDTEFKMWQDLDCWYRVLSTCDAINIKDISYVVDTEHQNVRITNTKKLEATYQRFCVKHDLSDLEKNLLRLHFYPYGIKKIPMTLFLKRFFFSKNILDLYYCLKRVLE